MGNLDITYLNLQVRLNTQKENTEKKILRSVFKKGDAYFNSGDLIYADEEHYVYFSDRIGDTFRCVTAIAAYAGILY